jgi:hypothetical protein
MQATSSDKRPLEGRHQEAEESHLDDIHNIRAYGAEVDKYSDGSINTMFLRHRETTWPIDFGMEW